MKVSEKHHIGYFSVHICRHVGKVYFECHIALLLEVVCKPDGGCGAVAEFVFNRIAVVVGFVADVAECDGRRGGRPGCSPDSPRMGIPLSGAEGGGDVWWPWKLEVVLKTLTEG